MEDIKQVKSKNKAKTQMADEPVSLSLSEGNFRCYLCDEVFVHPVTLPCRHSVCKLCLDKHFNNNGFTCPFCRARVSNWLRKLKLINADLVDTKFWNLIKKTFPIDVEARLTGITDVQLLPTDSGETDGCEIKVVILNEQTRQTIMCGHRHTQFDSQNSEPWRGWPDTVPTACRDVAYQVHRLSTAQTISSWDKPRLSISQPGEIRKEYEEFLLKEREEVSKEEMKNLKLSEQLIKMIEEDEAREREKQLEQLRADEELARLMASESSPPATATNETKKPSAITDRRRSKKSKVEVVERDTRCSTGSPSSTHPPQGSPGRYSTGGPSSTHPPQGSHSPSPPPPTRVSLHTSTPKPAGDSTLTDTLPIPLDTPSTSKDDIFSKYFRKTLASDSSQENVSEIPEVPVNAGETQPVPSTFSSPELSHFTSVVPRTSTSTNGPAVEVQSSLSRSSSGSDSIGQELRHFKPIRTSPTTPPKEGSSSWMPQVVVAQRGDVTSCQMMQMLCGDPDSDISAQDIEEAIALEKQIEADRELAAMLQKEFDAAENKRKRNGLFLKTDYNLRNKKKKGSLRKKVLVDRAQATLDSMLIK